MSDAKVEEKIVVGQISGVFGIKGWVKLYSHTDPRENILDYSPLWLRCKGGEWQAVKVLESQLKQGGKALVARLDAIDDRDVAREYIGCELAINRSQLVNPQDEMYWVDLIGCRVTNRDGLYLGDVSGLVETGAHDVLRVEGPHGDLIPFVMETFIVSVDIANKQIVVDWNPEADES